MTTKDKPRMRHAEAPGCQFEIHIHNPGTVNIYNCCEPGAPGSPRPTEECYPAPGALGACVPLALGAKPKQSRRRKLEKLLLHNRVPSALGASFFHLSRRFLAGRPPANSLEEGVFGVLRSLPPELKGVLSCALDSFDSLSPAQRDRLFAPSLIRDLDQPIDTAALAEAFGQELVQHAGVAIFDDPGGLGEERPGRIRVLDPGDEEIVPSPVRVCRLNGLRTVEYWPALSLGDYTPQELQQQCTLVPVDGGVQVDCQVQTSDCPGHTVSGACLRVPEIEAGQAVVLEGVNFFSVETKVRLVARPPGTATREVDAHVWGDLDTPLEEIVDGATRLINDCRVHDRLTFRVPDDLPPGIYAFQVAVPNITGFARFGDPVLSLDEYILVVPPATARFQIASETLYCRAETAPAYFGSDEVGLRVIAIPLYADITTGSEQVATFEFGDVDSSETRDMTRVLFSHDQAIAGVALSLIGFEIDSEEAYERQIDSFTEAFVEILKKEWELIAGALAAGGGLSLLKGLGVKGFIALAIAVAIVLVIDLFVALWAPADLIIEDAIGLSSVDLSALTSANFPAPAAVEYVTAGGIEVRTFPLDKGATEFTERREYISDDEESRYEVRLRYNRVA